MALVYAGTGTPTRPSISTLTSTFHIHILNEQEMILARNLKHSFLVPSFLNSRYIVVSNTKYKVIFCATYN